MSMSRMNRYTALGAGAILSLAGSAVGQSITPVAPVVNSSASANPIEYINAGDNVANGSEAFVVVLINAQTNDQDANNLTVLCRFFDATGAPLLGGAGIPVQDEDGSAVTGAFRVVNDAAGSNNGDNNIESNEVWAFNIESAIGAVTPTARFVTIELIVDADDNGAIDGGGNTAAFPNGFNADAVGGTNATNQAYEIVRTNTSIAQALFNVESPTTNSTMTLTFNPPTVGSLMAAGESVSIPVVVNAGGPNINATQAGGGAPTDFEFTDMAAGMGTQFNNGGAVDINAGSFANIATGTGLQFTFDSANSTLDNGAPFRVDPTTGVVRDTAGGLVGGIASPEQQENLTIDDVRFLTGNQVAVQFNVNLNDAQTNGANANLDLQIDGTSVGGAGAIGGGGSLFTSIQAPGTMFVDGGGDMVTDSVNDQWVVINYNPAQFNDATLRVAGDATANDTNTADANSIANAENSAFNIVVAENGGGVAFQSPFAAGDGTLGGDGNDDSQTFNGIGDSIAPQLADLNGPAAGGQAPSFHDLTGDDFKLDAVALVYDEPMATGSGGTGVTVLLVDGVFFEDPTTFDPTTNSFVRTEVDIAEPVVDNDDIMVTTSVASIDVNNNGMIDPREMNNAIVFSLPTGLDYTNGGDDLCPGTGGGFAAMTGPATAALYTVAYDSSVAGANIADASGIPAPTLAAAGATNDEAAPGLLSANFFTGDNQPPFPANQSNNQLLVEQPAAPGAPAAGDLGDQRALDRVALVATEVLAGGSNAIIEQAVQFTAPDGTIFILNDTDDPTGGGVGVAADGASDFLFSINNTSTFGFEAGAGVPGPGARPGSSAFDVGSTVNVAPGSGLIDTAGNELVSSSGIEVTDAVAPYVEFQVGVNGGTPFLGAFLLDNDGDGIADVIRLTFSEPVADLDAMAFEDFTAALGATITDADVDSDNPNVVELQLGGNNISINQTLAVTYNGASSDAADRLITEADEDGSNDPADSVSAANTTFLAQALPDANIVTENLAFFDIQGTVANAPRGTKIFAVNVIPVAQSAVMTHNGVTFNMDVTDPLVDTSGFGGSLTAMTNAILGIRSQVFLIRQGEAGTAGAVGTSGVNVNNQFFSNFKTGSAVFGEGGSDTIDVDLRTPSLTNVTFVGAGESPSDRIAGGRVDMGWDAARSFSGTWYDFYARGYAGPGGAVIASRTVIDNDSGTYLLHHSAPISAFNGRGLLNSIGWPIIIIVELPNGQRFFASSLRAGIPQAIDGPTAPVLFAAQNRTQSSGNAPSAVSFNIDLNNTNRTFLHPGWNVEGYPLSGGVANSNARVPVLPANVDQDNIQIGTSPIPNIGPLGAFGYWLDNNGDGVWTAADDVGGFLGSMIVDPKDIPGFAFVLDSFGVSLGSAIQGVAGGYGFAIFNGFGPAPFGAIVGVDQFGIPFTPASGAIFGSNNFPNNNTTQGWAIVTAPTSTSDINTFFTANPEVDAIFTFENTFGTNGQIQVSSSRNGVGDTESISAGQGLVTHFQIP